MTALAAPASFVPPIPVLHREQPASDAPPMLTPQADCAAQVQGRWWVAEVQTHHEKPLAWRLLELGLDYYLPLRRLETKIAGVRRRKIVPALPNYMFIAGDGSEKYCRESRYVFNLLYVSNQAKLRRELSSLEIAIFANPSLELIDVCAKGEYVRVTGGIHEGSEGWVDTKLSHGIVRLVLTVGMFGKGAILEIDKSFLEPTPPPAD